jgi:hypothetical protein
MFSSIKLLGIGVVVITLSFLLVACSSDNTSAQDGSDANAADTGSATDASTSSADTTQGSVTSDYVVSIDDATVIQNYEGQSSLLVSYTFTNNSEDSTSFMVAIRTQAFQNGIQLDTTFTSDDSYDSSASMKDIKPGATISVQSLYLLDDQSPVTIECRDWLSFSSDDLIATHDFTL